MALKLLHTADWHLGCRFSRFKEKYRDPLSQERLKVVENIFLTADRHGVDAILCAGDLFDTPQPEAAWWEGLVRILEKRGRSTCPVFFLPGNHDPLTESSIYAPGHAFRRKLPGFVQVVDRDDFQAELKGGAVLLAAPCRSHNGDKDPTLLLPKRQVGDERLRIGMVHGQTFDIPGNQTIFPIRRGAAAERGLDYLALGDTHAFRNVEPAGVPTVYPGAPEATAFDEKDTGQVAIVFLSRPGKRAIVSGERVGRWRWREVVAHSVAEVAKLLQEDLTNVVLRLRLEMRIGIRDDHRLRELLGELEGSPQLPPRASVLDLVKTDLRIAPDVGADDFPAELSPTLRSTVDRLRMRAEGPAGADRELATLALAKLWKLVQQAPRP